MFDLRDLIYVFIAGFVVGALFEKLGHEVKRRHDEKRGKVEKAAGGE